MEKIRYLDIWTARLCGAEELTREAIDAYTRDKLAETLEYAVKNSIFYRERYGAFLKKVGFAGGQCGGGFLEAFQKLPFTTREELRRRGQEFLCVSPSVVSRIVTLDTGGSTGAPKRICFTEEDQQLTVDYFCNGMQLLTDSSDKVLILMPAKMPGSIGKLLACGLRAFGADAVEYGLPHMKPSGDAEETRKEALALLQLMEEKGITSVVALPTHMRMLAEAALEERQDVFMETPEEPETPEVPETPEAPGGSDMQGAPSLKSVLLSAEYVPAEDVRLIEKVFGCKVYEHYGMTEMGLGCAVSCGCGKGYHVREADLYLEIINPETGTPAEDGAYGEIVFTTLTRKGMPFIRYRTGDYSRWLTKACGCGSILKRLDKVGPREFVKGYLK